MSINIIKKAGPTATVSGERTREIINSADSGYGLHFNGAGNIDIATPPDLGTKFSFEFILQADSIAASGYNYIADFGNGGGRFAIASIDGVLGIFDTNERLFAGVTFLDDLKAHHLVVTVDGTAAIAYDNGNQVGTATLGATSNIDSATDAKIGSRFDGTPFFNGTIYRCRFWNKTLSSTEVTDVYENATVNFADQWVGAATNMITGAVDKNWGTAQADSGNDATDRATFNTNYTWNTDGNITDISVASNVLQFTSASSGTSGLWYPTGTIVAGKRYRIIIRTGAITGGDFKVRVSTGSYVDLATLTASSTNVIDFVAPKSVLNYIYINSSDAGATIQLNAASVSNELFRAGVVADYDLAFANPTQSLTVQDRAGAADGTASATGVTQVTPIEQLNAKAARIGTTAATPADGELAVSGNILVSGADPELKIQDTGYAGFAFRGNANQLDLRNFGTGDVYLTIDSAGTVKIPRADDSAAHLSLSQSEGSGKTYNILADDAGAFVIRDGVTGRLTISSAGSVSTSTTAQEMLSVNSTNATGGYLTWKNSSASVLYLGNRNAISGGQATYGDGTDIWATAGRGLSFHTNAQGVPRINISSAGLTTVTNPGWPLKNELSNSGFGVWSNSTLEDATGTELVTNGTFTSDLTGWSASDGGGGGTIAVVSSELKFTQGGSSVTMQLQQSVTTVAGKLYRLTFDGKTASSSSYTKVTLGTASGGASSYDIHNPGWSAATGATTVVFEATSTTTYLTIYDAQSASNTSTWDDFSIKEVTPGCVAADALAFDGWGKHHTADIWRQHNDGGTLTKDGSFYSLKLLGGSADSDVYWPPSGSTEDIWSQRFAGRTVTFGAWIKATDASSARLRIYHGAYADSAYHTGGGAWEWIEMTHDCGASIGRIEFYIASGNGNTAYISQPMLVFGSAIGEGNYSRPQGEIVWCEKVVPINTSLSAKSTVSATTLNLEAETNGKFPKGALAVNARTYLRDSLSAGSTDGCRLKLYGSATASYGLDNSVNGLAADSYNYISGTVPCDSNGDIQYAIDTPGTGTSDSNISFYGIQLR